MLSGGYVGEWLQTEPALFPGEVLHWARSRTTRFLFGKIDPMANCRITIASARCILPVSTSPSLVLTKVRVIDVAYQRIIH